MTIQIVEVLQRSEQGITRPFICRGDDSEIYFVKGSGAGRRSQICEWICGNLGLMLGLPIAPFEIVNVPIEIIDAGGGLDLSELGPGQAFGSRKQAIMEITSPLISQVPKELQQDVIAYDWWIRNGDRNLTAQGGNPNLFWEPEDEKLLVIDHNQAFDLSFDRQSFYENHVFSSQVSLIFGDMHRRSEYSDRFMSLLGGWPDICDKIPEEWRYHDKEATVVTDFDFEDALSMLKMCKQDSFWTV